MSENITQVGFICAVSEVSDDVDFYDVEIELNGKKSIANLSYDRKIVFVVTEESDDSYLLDFTREVDISAVREELIEQLEGVGLNFDYLKPIKKFVNQYYNGTDNPLSLIEYIDYL